MSGVRRVAVVGGGVTGLTAAYTLVTEARARRLPLSCTVIERDGRWGGKVRSLRTDGLVLEEGPDAILRRKPWAVDLCRRLGLEAKLVGTAASGSYVRWGRKLQPLPEGLSFLVPTRLAPFVRSPLFTLAGKARLAAEYFIPPAPPGGDEPLGAFVRRRLGSEALERLAEPLLSGIYAGDVDRLSLLATFPQLRTMEQEHGGLLRAALAERRKRAEGAGARRPGPAGRGDRVAGAPAAPVRLSRGNPQSAFVSLEGGIATLIDALVDHLRDAECILGDGVREIRRTDENAAAGGGARGGGQERAPYRLVLESGRTIAADGVILAAPAYVQAALLGELAPAAAKLLGEIEYASVAGVVLVYPRASVPGEMRGTGYIVPRAMGGVVTAVTWASEKWPHVAPAGRTVLRCHIGKAGREDVTAWSDERLVAEARRELSETMGVRAEPEACYVYRWPRSMPQYAVGHLERVARIEESLRALPGVVVTGAALRGVGVPDCVRQGEEAARRLLQDLVEKDVGT